MQLSTSKMEQMTGKKKKDPMTKGKGNKQLAETEFHDRSIQLSKYTDILGKIIWGHQEQGNGTVGGKLGYLLC